MVSHTWQWSWASQPNSQPPFWVLVTSFLSSHSVSKPMHSDTLSCGTSIVRSSLSKQIPKKFILVQGLTALLSASTAPMEAIIFRNVEKQVPAWSQRSAVTMSSRYVTRSKPRDLMMYHMATTIKTQAYNAYVRTLAGYATTVWYPHTQENVRKLEMVQHLGAGWVLGRYHDRSSVTSMLEERNWRSIEQRRAYSWHVILYKMANSLVAIDASPS